MSNVSRLCLIIIDIKRNKLTLVIIRRNLGSTVKFISLYIFIKSGLSHHHPALNYLTNPSSFRSCLVANKQKEETQHQQPVPIGTGPIGKDGVGLRQST